MRQGQVIPWVDRTLGRGVPLLLLVFAAALLVAISAPAATGTKITIASSVGAPDRGDTANAIDGSTATETYTTPSYAQVRPSYLAFGFDSTQVNQIRLYKDNYVGPHDLAIQYTTDTGPLTLRTWTNVSGMVNGVLGAELFNATSTGPGGTVTGDNHISSVDGWASLAFDTVTATGLRISFTNTNPCCNHYHVFEFEAWYGPLFFTTTRTLNFDIYNQGRGTAAPSHVRAYVSDHASLADHVLGMGRDEELAVTIVAPPGCEGENCCPPLAPGESAHYTAPLEFRTGGFGRHVVTDEAGNAAVEHADGTFTLTSDATSSSRVSFEYGRTIWIDADSARDETGEKFDESGQQLAALLANDARGVMYTATSPTFGDLTHLSATFTSIAGGSGGGTPRLEVHLSGQGRIGIRLGISPAFSDTDATLNTFSDLNLIGNNDPGRYDLSALIPSGSANATYTQALAAAGAFTVERIDFVADDGPAREYTLERINVNASLP